MSFSQLALLNLSWLVLTAAGTIELLTKKKMGGTTVWLIIGVNFLSGTANIANLWQVGLGVVQLIICLLTYTKRDALMRQ